MTALSCRQRLFTTSLTFPCLSAARRYFGRCEAVLSKQPLPLHFAMTSHKTRVDKLVHAITYNWLLTGGYTRYNMQRLSLFISETNMAVSGSFSLYMVVNKISGGFFFHHHYCHHHLYVVIVQVTIILCPCWVKLVDVINLNDIFISIICFKEYICTRQSRRGVYGWLFPDLPLRALCVGGLPVKVISQGIWNTWILFSHRNI